MAALRIDGVRRSGDHARRMSFLRRSYFEIDPRTLGLARIAIASVLLVDLVKRWLALSIFYTNQGLIPNHSMLWRPVRRYTLSFLFALSERHEVQIAFALIALVYVCFLIGYRTRLAPKDAWRSGVFAPLFRGDQAVGVLVITR